MSNPKRTADQIAEKATRCEDISPYFTNKFTVVRPARRVSVEERGGKRRGKKKAG